MILSVEFVVFAVFLLFIVSLIMLVSFSTFIEVIGNMQLKNNNYEGAIKSFKLYQKLERVFGDICYIVGCSKIGEAQYLMKNYSAAQQSLTEAIWASLKTQNLTEFENSESIDDVLDGRSSFAIDDKAG